MWRDETVETMGREWECEWEERERDSSQMWEKDGSSFCWKEKDDDDRVSGWCDDDDDDGVDDDGVDEVDVVDDDDDGGWLVLTSFAPLLFSPS